MNTALGTRPRSRVNSCARAAIREAQATDELVLERDRVDSAWTVEPVDGWVCGAVVGAGRTVDRVSGRRGETAGQSQRAHRLRAGRQRLGLVAGGGTGALPGRQCQRSTLVTRRRRGALRPERW